MAGPLFTKGERDFNAQLARELRDRGVEVFLPQEKEERDLTAREVFDYDVQGIDGSDAVVACMDGPPTPTAGRAGRSATPTAGARSCSTAPTSAARRGTSGPTT